MTRVTISDRAEAIMALQNESYAVANEQMTLAKEMNIMMQRQYALAQRQGALGTALTKLLGEYYEQE